MKHLLSLFLKAFFALAVLPGCLLYAQNTGTTTMNATFGPEASIVINSASTALSSASVFAAFTGTTSFTYKIRTSLLTGSGTVQLQVTSDFSPTGGPSVATPPTAGDKLSYTCSVTSPAVSCVGSQTASFVAQTSVATFGTDSHSASAGNSGSVSWSLTNDATYKTNTYSAVITFTISAT